MVHEEMEDHPIRWVNGGEFTVGDLETDAGIELNIRNLHAKFSLVIMEKSLR